MRKLICKKVYFYSEGDELIFFEWLKRIPAITNINGVGDEIQLSIDSNTTIDDQSLRELLAIFYRYKIDMMQLSQFRDKANEGWFYDNKSAYWHRGVFE